MDRSTLPPLDIVGPSGDRLTLRALGHEDTVGVLARHLDVDRLWTSRQLEADERLVDIDELRVGTRLSDLEAGVRSFVGTEDDTDVATDTNPEPIHRPIVKFEVVTGPSSTSWSNLAAGRHIIGRAPHATVRLDDPSIEAHHALLRIDSNGTVELTQLTGATPIRVDGRPWQGVVDDLDTEFSIGASSIRLHRIGRDPAADEARESIHDEPVGETHEYLRPAVTAARGSIAPHPSDPWRRIVWRAPYDEPEWTAPTLSAPISPVEPQRPSSTSLVGAGVMACGAVVIATVMGNAMFVLFAAMGAAVAVATFVAGVVTAHRRRTRLRRQHTDALASFARGIERLREARRAHHRRVHRTVSETLDEALEGGALLWQRRVSKRSADRSGQGTAEDDEVALRATVGRGTHRWSPPVEIPDRGALDSALVQHVERCAALDRVVAPVSIRPGDAIAFHGARRHGAAIVRSVVAQLATWTGPADWQLVVVSDDPSAWRWVDWLPHGALEQGALVVVDDHAGTDHDLVERLDAIDLSRRTVLVTDAPQLFATRTGPLRRFATASNAASLVVVDTDATVPAMCRRTLTVGTTGSASWSGDVDPSDDAAGIAFAGISVDTADRVARRLACLVDPEDDGGATGGVPASVSFSELFADLTPDVIASRWRDGGADPAPVAPVGFSLDGRVDIDLVRDGPHGLIAGTTGSGKSELLRTLVIGLAASVGPQHLNFVLVDYKGGSTFDACIGLPHTVGLVTDLDDGLAERALVSLEAELQRREELLRSVGACDLTDYRSRQSDDGIGRAPIARLVVVIDEFAALAKELPDFLAALVGIAQRGRSLGVHLLLATQRPAGVINDDIRANTNLRLALRVHDRTDAVDVVGDELPANFPRGISGRAALRLGPDELVVFQAARCTGPAVTDVGSVEIVVDRHQRVPDLPGGASRCSPIDPDLESGDNSGADDARLSELEVAVESVASAAARSDLAAPHRPWVDPLPFPLPLDQLGLFDGSPDGAGDRGGGGRDTPIGWVDDPTRQRRRALSWRPIDGSLALIGSVGSGTTSTLIALAAATCGATAPRDLHLYVIDARGDEGLSALAALAHCGGVVRMGEDERLHRLLARVVDAIDRRTGLADGSVEPELVVMIDGYGSLRSSLGPIERQATFELLRRVVEDGPPVGVALVIADEASTAATMAPVAHRWLFHVDDPSAARGFGLRTAPVGPGTPGRLRIASSGLEAQVAQGAAGLAALPARGDADAGGPGQIDVLPERVRIGDVVRLRGADGRSESGVDRSARLLVGIRSDDLRPAEVDLVDREHLLIVGGPRTGVSTALECAAVAWATDAERRGEPFRLLRVNRRTGLESDAVAEPGVRLAIVVDDAHRVDDPGVLAEIVRGDHPQVTLLVGVRADAVRTSYGHWTRDVAKSRCGLVMASRGDPDGDVLSVQIPRRPLIPARPGLAWLVDGGPLRQAQIAMP